jgi:2'-hydroxyisoflavone reductase
MRLLVLGGTGFLGRHLVDRALQRDYDVTLFNRRRSAPMLFPDVERVIGDRGGDLTELQGRDWDAVIDTSGYLPRIVDATAAALVASVGHYTFISSVSAYADVSAPGIDERAATATLSDPTSEHIAEDYGALKAECEQQVLERFGERGLIIRPGLIVGPYDPTGRFTYWVRRLAEGGDVLAPQPTQQPVQLIDARDLAEWTLDLVKAGHGGVLNAVGPAEPLTLSELIYTCRDATGSAPADIVWVDEAFLLEHGVRPWSDLPLWLAPEANPDLRGFLSIDGGRARSVGLTFRPLNETIADTLAWALASGDGAGDGAGEEAPGAGLTREREQTLLDAWAST